MITYVTVPSSGFSSTTQETNKFCALIQGKFLFKKNIHLCMTSDGNFSILDFEEKT